MPNHNLIAWGLLIAVAGLGGCPDDADHATPLDGTWLGSCRPRQDGTSRQRLLEFDGTDVIQRDRLFASGDCDDAAIDISMEGTFTLGESGALRAVDLEVLAMRITPLTAADAAQLSDEAFCGIASWEVDRATEITGRSCGGAAADSAGTRYFTVVQIEPSQLVFGALTTAEADRPTDVDPTQVFVRTDREETPEEPEPEQEGEFFCTAEGTLRDCLIINDVWEQCSFRPIVMSGIGDTQEQASSQALLACGREITTLLVILNLNPSARYATISRSCEIVSCS